MNVEFIDTNILIYAHDTAGKIKHAKAVELIQRLEISNTGALSTQVLVEFLSVGSRKLKLSNRELQELVSDFSYWTIHRPGHADILQALALQRNGKISWWDALVLNSAIQVGASILWSEDLQSNRHFGKLQVKNPFLEEEH